MTAEERASLALVGLDLTIEIRAMYQSRILHLIQEHEAEVRREQVETDANIAESEKLLSGSIGPLFGVGWGAAIKSCGSAIRAQLKEMK